MPPTTLTSGTIPRSGRFLSFPERENIALYRAQHLGIREIARRLGRAASTISRVGRRARRSASNASETSSQRSFETLKRELVDDQVYETHGQARRAIFEYVEVYYNRKRLHSTLGVLDTP